MSFGGKKGPRRLQKRGPSGALEETTVLHDYEKGPQWNFAEKNRHCKLKKGAPVVFGDKKRQRKLKKGGPSGNLREKAAM